MIPMKAARQGGLALLFLFTACADRDSLSAPDPGEVTPSIADASHGSGDHFYFLPPLVTQPTLAGTFDPALSPIVEICEWAETGCEGPLVAHFSGVGADGSETVRVNLEDEHYIVDWHTSRYELLTGNVYRVRVLLEGVELGHADVVLVADARETHGAGGGELIPVVNGRTLPIKFRIEEGAAAPDETPPVLTGVAFTPAAIDVTEAAGAVTIDFTVTDDRSGVDRVTIVLANPSTTDEVSCTATAPTSGTTQEGTFSCEVGFDSSSEWGFWAVSQLVLADAAGNTATLSRGDLRDAGFPTAVEVIAPRGTGDITRAELFDFSFTPTLLDIREADGTVTVDVGWTDGQSGVGFVFVAFQHPETGQFRSCSSSQPATGSRNDGTWRCTFTIPRFSAGGTWVAISVQATDLVGNHIEIGETQLDAGGFPTRLEVVSDQDVTRPTLTALSFTPDQLDIRESDGTVTVDVGWTDGQSGVGFVFVAFQHPETGQFRSCSSSQPATGSRNDGTWRCTFTIPRFSAGGTWIVISLQATDLVGNHVEIGEAQLDAGGFPTRLEVVSDQDVTTPTLTAFSFDPTTVDVRTVDGVVSVSVGWTDGQAGVSSVFVAFQHPETGQFRSCSTSQPESGTPNDGTWVCAFNMPKLSAAGSWFAISVQATDLVGNHIEMGRAQLEAAGFPTALEVVSGQ